jgi:hypothetical protein
LELENNEIATAIRTFAGKTNLGMPRNTYET